MTSLQLMHLALAFGVLILYYLSLEESNSIYSFAGEALRDRLC